MGVTIQDIAADAGVSVSTVSRVINGSSSVSEEKRERVLTSIKRNHFHPSAAARSLITKQSGIVAVLVSDLTNPTISQVLEEINGECIRNNKVAVISEYSGDNQKAVTLLIKMREQNVDGLVFMGVSFNEAIIEELRQFVCPVILANQGIQKDNCEFATITADGYHAICDVTKFFAMEGHSRIAFIGGNSEDYTNEQLRLRGFLDAMKDLSLQVPESYIYEGKFSIESGMKGMESIYAHNQVLPTAVIAGSDLIAIGVIRYLQSVGLRVPDDMSVFGFDDSVSDIFEIPLSTVRGIHGGKEICALLFDPDMDRKEKHWSYYPYQLIRRNSTRRLE